LALFGAVSALRQLRVAREGQITDRYTKAIDQLDKDKALAVRLGGLYALERIARDSRADRATIAEVLCAYARTAPRNPSESVVAAVLPVNHADIDLLPGRLVRLEVRAPDVQAALTILGRWRERLHEPPPVVDLHGADLRGANLGSDLRVANLGADLQGANLAGADLQGGRPRVSQSP
jgi:hypothetical protein